MKDIFKSLFVTTTTITLLSACTSGPLQSSRLNKAEGYMMQAEHALSTNKPNRMKIADSNIGTANAYILTVRDNLKHLTKAEKVRYHALKAKADKIESRIVR